MRFVILVSIYMSAVMADEVLFIGSYTNQIQTYVLSSNSYTLSPLATSESGENPSWLVLSRSKRFLFAVNEVNDYEDGDSGAISSYRIEDGGNLTLINRVPSGGGSPAHLAVDDTDSFLYVSNYCGGNIAVIAVSPEGSLQSPCQVVQHISDPIAPCEQSQGTSHVHEVTFSSNRSVLVNDLGHNQIFEYAVDADGLLVTPPVAVTHSPRSGAGPRHSLIHPSGRYAFVINELSSSMTSYYYDSSCASLGSEIMTISTLRPDENATDMAAAELQISSNGKYLYGSNRDISSPNLGRNSIVVFAVDEVSGMLKTLQHVDTRGEHPRFFNFFLNETVLLVGNMNSNTIATFLVGNDTGTLTPVNADEMTSVDAPTHMVKYR